MPVASAHKVASKLLRCAWQEKVARIPCGGRLKTIHERIGHALTGSFTLDVYSHTLDWRENEEAAQKLGDSIAKAVADPERNSDNSDCLTATK